MGNMFKMMMFSQMMNGKSNNGDMGQMMAMSMMMGDNMFSGLFDEINEGLSEFSEEEIDTNEEE